LEECKWIAIHRKKVIVLFYVEYSLSNWTESRIYQVKGNSKVERLKIPFFETPV
jgi:hypothetical protein